MFQTHALLSLLLRAREIVQELLQLTELQECLETAAGQLQKKQAQRAHALSHSLTFKFK